jgi:1-acyl-sn-glycerol-3-phosphate acyltransferase
MLNGIMVASIIEVLVSFGIALGIAQVLFPRKSFSITQKLVWRVAHHIFNAMKAFVGATLEFENCSGQELPERFLLVTNHQSLMDIPLLIDQFSMRRIRFVAKKELGRGVPFVSLVLRSQGHALITRKGDATRAMRTILKMTRRCEAEGTCPVIFPEGTRSRDGQVGEFHTAGVRKILDETPLPMVVAVIDGGYRLSKLENVIGDISGIRFRVRVLDVTPPLSAKREVLSALEKARADIAAGLVELRKEA